MQPEVDGLPPTRGDSTRPPRLRVVLDARVVDGGSGGVQQWIIGLASSLSKLESNGDEYLFLVHPGEGGWLEPYLSGPCRTVMSVDRRHRWLSGQSTGGRWVRRVPPARRAWHWLRETRRAGDETLPVSD